MEHTDFICLGRCKSAQTDIPPRRNPTRNETKQVCSYKAWPNKSDDEYPYGQHQNPVSIKMDGSKRFPKRKGAVQGIIFLSTTGRIRITYSA
jgi:hypothetical protein